MRKLLQSLARVPLLALIICSASICSSSISPAFATLGENERSIDTNPGAQGNHATPKAHYTLHETVIRGAHVRQFAVPGGNVFAVAWNGKSHPDLMETLGIHYASFEAALAKAKAANKGRHPIVIEDNGIHVEMGGQMGAVRGAAWLIDQVPNGVAPNEIR